MKRSMDFANYTQGHNSKDFLTWVNAIYILQFLIIIGI